MRTSSNTNDDDRVRLATLSANGRVMLGPVEYQRCTTHPRRWEGYRWFWDVGSTPESGDAEMVKACDQCDDEASDECDD